MDPFSKHLSLYLCGCFSAHRHHRFAKSIWEVADCGWLPGMIRPVGDEARGGRVVSCLQGGYDLPALAASVAAHVAVIGRQPG